MDTYFELSTDLILGGTSGIGLATAERAAAGGATVIVASSSAERIDAALERLPASAEGYTVNVRHPGGDSRSLQPIGQLRPSRIHRG